MKQINSSKSNRNEALVDNLWTYPNIFDILSHMPMAGHSTHDDELIGSKRTPRSSAWDSKWDSLQVFIINAGFTGESFIKIAGFMMYVRLIIMTSYATTCCLHSCTNRLILKVKGGKTCLI